MVVIGKARGGRGLESDNIPLEKLAQHFQAYNRTEGKSPRTMECYNSVLRYFGDFLREHNYPYTLGRLNIHVVREFKIVRGKILPQF